MSMPVCSGRVADPQHGLKCGFQRFMNKQTEHPEGIRCRRSAATRRGATVLLWP